ncbi:ABC transporter substrate-binding protein [Aminobacter sp. Piv2-1]|uniref:ABC transporter substrate-binding protein n=1 Tax=Aminobacter sp. Piv2-1 TaxID=3031122 RepID=UPI0030B66A65
MTQLISRRAFGKLVTASAGLAALSSLPSLMRPVYAQGAGGIVIAIANDPQSLDPLAIESQVPAQVTWNVYEPLLTRDTTGKIVPGLAESFTRTSPTTAQVKLKSGIRFHDGSAFDAEAAAFSINRIIDPQTKSQWIGTVNTITGAKAIASDVVEISTKEPDPVLEARLTVIAMMAPGWTKEVGNQVGVQANGTGPYKFIAWKRNLSVDLEANADYWGGTPSIKAITFRIIPEDATRYQSVKTKEVDLYLGLLPDQISGLEKYAAGIGQEFSFIRFSNLEGSGLADPRLRQAINYAVDKAGIHAALYQSQGALLNGQLSAPGMFGYNPNLQPYPYDLEKARSLVQEAGAQGRHITIEGPKGRYTGDAVELQALAAMIEQSGLGVNLVLRDPNNWVRIGDRNQTPVPPEGWYVRHDNSTFDADRTLGSYYTPNGSYSAYQNKEIDDLFAQSRKEMDSTKREGLLHNIFDIGREKDPMGLFLFQHAALWGMTPRVNFTPRADGLLFVKDINLTA